jgi:hypothetical protein
MKQHPVVLEITKRDKNCYRFRMSSQGEPFMGPVQQVWDTQVNSRIVTDCCKEISNAVELVNRSQAEPGIILNSFKATGEGLYNEFLPKQDPFVEKLRQSLRELKSPLLISTDAPTVFWELMHDEENFIGIKYQVGRRLLTRSVPGGVPRRDKNWRCLMIADPNEDDNQWALPGTATEAAKLQKWFKDRNVNCDDFLQGKNAKFETVFKKLRENTYDFIHYAGHIVKRKKEYALKLNGDKSYFTASDIKKHGRGTPIVFLNGCWSAKAKGIANPLNSVEGLTDAFLAVGAQVVVGALFEVPDEGARAFAEKFYESVLNFKTVGEAMQLAREYTVGKDKYAATWACFVMYGDPCLRVELKEDELQKNLTQIGLDRMNFEVSCCQVVSHALEYGRPIGIAGTPHLFAAMIAGENSFLRDRLKEQDVSYKKLQEVFQKAFRLVKSIKEMPYSPAKFSENVEDILKKAMEIAKSKECEEITELDLAAGFAAQHGGETGEVLHKLGVNVKALSPIPIESPEPDSLIKSESIRQIGLLDAEDYTKDAWKILVKSMEIAKLSGSNFVGTPHLCVGMLQVEQGALSRALNRLGINPEAALQGFQYMLYGGEQVKKKMSSPETIDRDINFSNNATNILLTAKTCSVADNRDKVSDGDLLAAFVRQDGGETGKLLRRMGLVTEALVSDVFRDNGELNASLFDETAWLIIEKALECGRKKGHERLGRRHILYAMLSMENGLLPGLIRSQGKNAEQLSEFLYTSSLMSGGMSLKNRMAARTDHMATELIKIFCAAELEAKNEQGEKIGERHLMRACIADGCGKAGGFLVKHGVSLNKLTAG